MGVPTVTICTDAFEGLAMYKADNWPEWVDTDDEEALCPIVGAPEDIHIVVSGGPGKHSAFIPTFGTSKSVTRKIEPAGR